MTIDEPEFDLGPGRHPGKMCRVIRRISRTGQRQMDWMEWGLRPHDSRDLVAAPRPTHARAETILQVPMFAHAFPRRRAIVAVDSYFQRQTNGGEGLYAITRADKQPMALAALWESFVQADQKIVRSFCLITIEAAPPVSKVHNRMPLVIEPVDLDLWLGDADGDPAGLLRPLLPGVLQCRLAVRP